MIIREYLYEAPNVGKLELSVWGLSKEDLESSIEILDKIASAVNAKVVHKRIVEVKKGRYIGEVLIRLFKDKIPVQVNVAVMGHVNATRILDTN